MFKKFNLAVAGGILALVGLTGCDYVDSGIVKDRDVRQDGIETQYWIQIEKAVSHDTDARHWIQVGRIEWQRCDYNELWEDADVGGCDARVRDNPPGW